MATNSILQNVSLFSSLATNNHKVPPFKICHVSQKPAIIKQICPQSNFKESFLTLTNLITHKNSSQKCIYETYSLLLELCATQKALKQGKQIHTHVLKFDLEHNDSAFLNTKIVFMYGKCGSIGDAAKVFDKMPERTVFTWNAMIGGCVLNGVPFKALELYRDMRFLGVCLDAHTLSSTLKATSQVECLYYGSEIHGLAIKVGLISNIFVVNSLVSMYTKCNDIGAATLLFDGMSEREDVVSWNSMISAYVVNGMNQEALSLFIEMLNASVEPTAYTFVSAIQACEETKFGKFGAEIHGVVVKLGYSVDMYVVNALLMVYGKNNRVDEAAKIFFHMQEKDNISWNSMISGYVQNGLYDEAINLFHEMKNAGQKPDHVSLMSMLVASGRQGNLLNGMEIHAFSLRNGLASDLQVGNTLVDMYAKCDKLDYMVSVFDRMLHRDNVSWTTIIAAYSQNNFPQKAVQLFREVQAAGSNVDALMIGSVLLACTELRCNLLAKEIHCYVIKKGLYDPVIQKTLVSVYGDCGNVDYANSIFRLSEVKDVISFTSMMCSYVENGLANEALGLMLYMNEMEIEADFIAVLSMLNAAADLSSLRKGKEIHGFLVRKGFLLQDSFRSSLIDMYASCGTLENSYKVFNYLKSKDPFCWTSMINACGLHGRGREAIDIFTGMEKENIHPDHITFLAVLRACSHAALIEDGKRIFKIMQSKYGLEPWPEHYACLVDLLGRANHLEEAFQIVKTMNLEDIPAVWCALLGACQVYSNKELGEIAAMKLLELEPKNPGNYVLVSNVYAATNRWDDVEEVRVTIKEKGLKKDPACSWIEVGDKVHTFVAHDKSHPECNKIYEKLAHLTEKLEEEAGYVAQTKYVLHNVEEKEKVKLLKGHSERLAIAYGLLASTDRNPIRITKNLRVCSDCHTFSKLASKFLERDIIVRDAKRFHHFRNGICSCGDFW
ncbi:pentatricopeptide repeat-containing protein At3g63370, chloroplastic [Lycium ferocissimum]|uniref:pentatricopeptide repeat-containing protein At3g63370, chloroplastic n=1 Tax=Lycium ferocissimum TaxID=112874 RepID=UPI00281656F6|nr:pentatricopeptide repeat-containing protein At3g63370, chloroplastic [Lycium ferocissimum]